jgi:broad specificity phosphatase PhoE
MVIANMTSTSDGTTFLYLVRHGATDANEQRPYILQGCGINHGLSETGRQQARAVADFLSTHLLQEIYSSELQRAVETASTIAERHNIDVQTVAGLHECDVGQWEGKDWGSIEHTNPEEYNAFMNAPGENPYLGGESYGDVLRRVEPVLGELIAKHAGQAFAVVAHNVVNRAYLGNLLGLDMRQARRLSQSNTGVNIIRHRDGETSLVTMNAHFHLSGLGE